MMTGSERGSHCQGWLKAPSDLTVWAYSTYSAFCIILLPHYLITCKSNVLSDLLLNCIGIAWGGEGRVCSNWGHWCVCGNEEGNERGFTKSSSSLAWCSSWQRNSKAQHCHARLRHSWRCPAFHCFGHSAQGAIFSWNFFGFFKVFQRWMYIQTDTCWYMLYLLCTKSSYVHWCHVYKDTG